MPFKYIIVIVGASLFFLLFTLYIILSVRGKKREALRKEETEKLIRDKQAEGGQLTIDEVMASSSDDNVFQTVEKEGLEEITGNYKPE